MAVNYNKLWKMMIDKKMSKTELTNLAGISTNAMAKLGKNEDVRVNILENCVPRSIANWTILLSLFRIQKNKSSPQNQRKESMLCRSVRIYINTS